MIKDKRKIIYKIIGAIKLSVFIFQYYTCHSIVSPQS